MKKNINIFNAVALTAYILISFSSFCMEESQERTVFHSFNNISDEPMQVKIKVEGHKSFKFFSKPKTQKVINYAIPKDKKKIFIIKNMKTKESSKREITAYHSPFSIYYKDTSNFWNYYHNNSKRIVNLVSPIANSPSECFCKIYKSYFLRSKNRSDVPLISAVQEKKINEVETLLYEYANANIEDESGTPLTNAACLNNPKLLEMLLEYGADANYVIHNGATAIHFAILMNSPRIVELLINKNAKINRKDNSGITPLMIAALIGNSQIFEMILPHSKVNAVGDLGETALGFAVKNNFVDIAKSLLDVGAYVNIAYFGDTALNLVKEQGSTEMKALFQEYNENGLLKYKASEMLKELLNHLGNMCTIS